MKKFFLMLFVAVLVVPFIVSAGDIKKGDRATVPEEKWVKVKNLSPVFRGKDFLVYGGSCYIQRGGVVEAIGADKDLVLVNYSTVSEVTWSHNCPTGTLLFVTKQEFSSMTAEYKRIQAAEQAEKELIRRLINK